MAYDVNPLLDRLCEAFPACFSRLDPKPLQIGLDEELRALAGVASGPGRPDPHPTPPGASVLRPASRLPPGAGEGRPPLRSGRATGRGGHARTAARRLDAPEDTARAGPERVGTESADAKSARVARVPGDGIRHAEPEETDLKKSGRAISRGIARPFKVHGMSWRIHRDGLNVAPHGPDFHPLPPSDPR